MARKPKHLEEVRDTLSEIRLAVLEARHLLHNLKQLLGAGGAPVEQILGIIKKADAWLEKITD